MELLKSNIGWLSLLITLVVIFLYKKISKNPNALTSKFEIIKQIEGDSANVLTMIKEALKNAGF